MSGAKDLAEWHKNQSKRRYEAVARMSREASKRFVLAQMTPFKPIDCPCAEWARAQEPFDRSKHAYSCDGKGNVLANGGERDGLDGIKKPLYQDHEFDRE